MFILIYLDKKTKQARDKISRAMTGLTEASVFVAARGQHRVNAAPREPDDAHL